MIKHNGRPWIIDTLLTFIFMMGQEASHFLIANKGSQYIVYDYLQPAAPHITQDT